jgi:hypothetical protein
MAEKNYDAKNEMVIRREEMKLERARAKAESLKENMVKTLDANWRKVRNQLVQDMREATDDPGRMGRIKNAVEGSFGGEIDEGEYTGWESKPWER